MEVGGYGFSQGYGLGAINRSDIRGQEAEGGWLARHRTIEKLSAPHRLDISLSMGTEQCAVAD